MSDEPPAPIALLIALSRARHALQRARALPGMPLLTLGRRVRATGGAFGPDGELPWAAGPIPAFQRDDHPAPPSSAISRTVSPWPHVGQEHHDSVTAPPTTAIRSPDRPAGATPVDPVSTPRPTSAPELADSRPESRPPPLVGRAAATPGLVPAGQPLHPPLPPSPLALPARTGPPYASPPPVAALSPLNAPSPASPRAAPAALHAGPARPGPPMPAPPSLPQPAARLSARFRPTIPQRANATDPALPWAERRWPNMGPVAPPVPVVAGPAQMAAPSPAAALAPPLVQHASHATPASVSTVIALGEGIQHSVRQELDEMRAIVTRMGKEAAPPAAAPPPQAATGDAARHLLGRMRTILQEEQFRRGNIR